MQPLEAVAAAAASFSELRSGRNKAALDSLEAYFWRDRQKPKLHTASNTLIKKARHIFVRRAG